MNLKIQKRFLFPHLIFLNFSILKKQNFKDTKSNNTVQSRPLSFLKIKTRRKN